MSEIICYIPAAVVLLYLLFILLKPADEADLFFELHRKTAEEQVIRRIEILEKRHRRSYDAEKAKIRGYFRDGKLTDVEVEFLENIMVRAFFNGFQKRWAVFREADWFSRLVFLMLVLTGFLSVTIVLAYRSSAFPDSGDFMMALAGSILLFPFPYALVLILVGVLSLLLSIMRFIFPSNGALARATVLSEEFVKALKPGGRSTQVVLPKRISGNLDI